MDEPIAKDLTCRKKKNPTFSSVLKRKKTPQIVLPQRTQMHTLHR